MDPRTEFYPSRTINVGKDGYKFVETLPYGLPYHKRIEIVIIIRNFCEYMDATTVLIPNIRTSSNQNRGIYRNT